MFPVLFFVLFIVLLSRSFLRRGHELYFIPPMKFSSYPRCGTGGQVRPDLAAVAGAPRRGLGRVFPPPEMRACALQKDNAHRTVVRGERSVPVLARIRARMDELLPGTTPDSKLAKAIKYADGIWPRLLAYAQDGRQPIDNNPAEQMIRPIAIGRNNWLFFGSERGGRAAANLMSIIATCKRAKVEPFAYLCDVFRRLPAAKSPKQVRALLPDVWKPA